jgi:hypothetical protein
MGSRFIALPGSTRTAPPHWNELPACQAEDRIEISVRVRRRAGAELPSVEQPGAFPLHERRPLSRAELGARFGADRAALAAVERHAVGRGFKVIDVCPARRRVLLAGPLGALVEAFPADVRRVEHRGVAYRQRCGAQYVPAALAGSIEALFGFCSSPLATPYLALPERADAPAVTSHRTEKGWIDALEAAIHDGDELPSVIHIRWPGADLETEGHLTWTESAISAINTSLQEAALLGIEVVCEAGDGRESLVDGARLAAALDDAEHESADDTRPSHVDLVGVRACGALPRAG